MNKEFLFKKEKERQFNYFLGLFDELIQVWYSNYHQISICHSRDYYHERMVHRSRRIKILFFKLIEANLLVHYLETEFER